MAGEELHKVSSKVSFVYMLSYKSLMVSHQRGTLKKGVIGLSWYSLVPWFLLRIEKISLLLQTASYLEIWNLLELCASRAKFYGPFELEEVWV